MHFLYTILIYLYQLAVHIVSPFQQKARARIKGVQDSNKRLAQLPPKSKKRILIHCASQGEHEQALPIIRWIIANTDYDMLLSFYSPSGYDHADYQLESRVTKLYLPFDTPGAMSNFLTLCDPNLVLIIKNEWWWNLLHLLRRRSLKSYLIAATIRSEHYFIRIGFSFFRQGLKAFSTIFVIDTASKNHLTKVFNGEVVVAGDTRMDQVNFIKKDHHPYPDFKVSTADKKTIVYGSIWTHDIPIINQIIHEFPEANHIIYPHDLNDKNLQEITHHITGSKIVSKTVDTMSRITVVSAMGELKHTYQLADFAYIGGGFGVGIHNILEAAGYFIPTLIGPNYKKSSEAIHLVEQGCAFVVKDQNTLLTAIEIISKEKMRTEIESKLKAYFSPRFSPTERICQEIFR